MTDLERNVAAHYGKQNLASRLLDALQATGLEPEKLSVRDLGAVDEFHIGGRPATEFLLSKLGLNANQHVLDVGCGIGGATRVVADTCGCRVTGIDLTPEYIDAARELTRRTGLEQRISYEVASALGLPFPDASFDAAITIHVAMNIRDRPRLYSEVARVLKSGARFGIYDVMRDRQDGLQFPVPWANSEETSHLTTPAEMHRLLDAAGFTIEETIDRKAEALAFFRERMAAAAAGGPPPIGLHLIMDNAPTKMTNMLANLQQGRITPVMMIARRR